MEPAGPAEPAGPIAPTSPVAPEGMVNSKTLAVSGPESDIEAAVPGRLLVAVGVPNPAAAPTGPVAPASPVAPLGPVGPGTVLAAPTGPVGPAPPASVNEIITLSSLENEPFEVT